MAKKNQPQDESLENVQEALSTSGQWIEKHQNAIFYTVLGICVVVCGFIALNKFVWAPKAEEAQNESAKAVVYFAANQFDVALNGDEADCLGFAEIADKYSHYQAGKLASLYAGICSYKLGEYEDAVKYIKKFDANDLNIAPAAKQLLGDAYVELGEYSKAVSAYKDAVKTGNEVIAPMSLKKMGLLYADKLDDKAAALKAFEAVKNDYAQSAEAQDIDKYIEYVK